MNRQSNAIGLACVLVCSALGAQPSRSAEAYGDSATGQFGDPARGYFGDPSQGEFRRHNFNRAQEGTVPVLKGTPIERMTEIPPPPRQSATTSALRRNEADDAPYLRLEQPVD